ncbi:DUF2147 domain-containing protein [Pseudogulbenkiania sp. MAI-1]|uniref:DUF2147 domain-containing protein n=1 Tax=Pseudogulbenkiania sp. MAI-1 TaxID=990370 RepID=UPI00045EB0BB|nr:DUF2147 domain-containing protein [Pseudogulbenkiania sp. MAI-1]
MKRVAKWALLALSGGLLAQSVLAQGAAGTWKTIDDETKQAKALVQISEGADGQLSGKIVKLFSKPDAVCEKCDGANKGKPVNGLTILWGLKKDGEGWNGGEILDPKSGKVYSAKMKLVDGGNKLEVRGFLGVALLGRTQVWERQ